MTCLSLTVLKLLTIFYYNGKIGIMPKHPMSRDRIRHLMGPMYFAYMGTVSPGDSALGLVTLPQMRSCDTDVVGP